MEQAEMMVLATVLVPIITGLLQVVKQSVNLRKNWIPAVAVITGLIIGLIASPFSDLDLAYRLWAGGLAGMGSVGFFELGNKREGTTKEEEKDDENDI